MGFLSRSNDWSVGDILTETALESEFDAIYNLLNGTTAGDLSINGDLTVKGGGITVSGVATTVSILDNSAASLDITESSNSYLKFITTDSSEAIVASKDVGIGTTPSHRLHVYEAMPNGVQVAGFDAVGGDSWDQSGFSCLTCGSDASRTGLVLKDGTNSYCYIWCSDAGVPYTIANTAPTANDHGTALV